jgi:hypothetical protein
VNRIVREQVDERVQAADEYDRFGRGDEAERLRSRTTISVTVKTVHARPIVRTITTTASTRTIRGTGY